MKRWVKNTLTASLCLIPVGLVIGFSNSWSNKAPISCVGSSGVKPFVEELSKDYMKSNKNVDITVEAGGSGFGIQQIAEGYANIGNASTDPYSAVQPAGKDGFREQWIDNNIKTITIGWEAICLVYIPPKGFNFNGAVNINNILSIDESNIVNFMRVFSGINEGISWDSDSNISNNSMWHFRNTSLDGQWPGNDEQLLKDTSIIPYVRAGGSLTSGTAASFVNGTHLNVGTPEQPINPYDLLSTAQKSAFDSGEYGVSFGIQQTDEANSRAWDMFTKSNIPGQIVYLSSGFIAQNQSLLNNKGYGLMSYKETPYDIRQIDSASGYNWFRPLNTLISVDNQDSPEIAFIKYLLTNPTLLEQIGCKALTNTGPDNKNELKEMFPSMTSLAELGEWYSDYALSTTISGPMHDSLWSTPEEWPEPELWNFAPIPKGIS